MSDEISLKDRIEGLAADFSDVADAMCEFQSRVSDIRMLLDDLEQDMETSFHNLQDSVENLYDLSQEVKEN